MKLTERERQVRELRVAGLTIDQTAERLGIRPSTVSKHRASAELKVALARHRTAMEPLGRMTVPGACAYEGAD